MNDLTSGSFKGQSFQPDIDVRHFETCQDFERSLRYHMHFEVFKFPVEGEEESLSYVRYERDISSIAHSSFL